MCIGVGQGIAAHHRTRLKSKGIAPCHLTSRTSTETARRVSPAGPRHAARIPVPAVRVDGEALAVAAAACCCAASLSEVTGPVFGHDVLKANDFDLTKQHAGEPIGERIVVSGRVLDGNARPVANTLVEIWQANAAGRYPHSATSTTRRPIPTSPVPAAR